MRLRIAWAVQWNSVSKREKKEKTKGFNKSKTYISPQKVYKEQQLLANIIPVLLLGNLELKQWDCTTQPVHGFHLNTTGRGKCSMWTTTFSYLAHTNDKWLAYFGKLSYKDKHSLKRSEIVAKGIFPHELKECEYIKSCPWIFGEIILIIPNPRNN